MLSKVAEQCTELGTKQGTGIGTELFLENSRSLTIIQSCVNVSKHTVSKRTKWATALQLGKGTQIAKVYNS